MKDEFARQIRSIGVASRLVTAACIIGFAYYGRVVFMPLALALLIAFALNPLVRRLMTFRMPRAMGVALTVGAFVLTLAGISWFIGGQLTAFAGELPKYRTNIVVKVQEFKAAFSGGTLDKLRDTVNKVNTDSGAAPAPVVENAIAESSNAIDWISSAGAVTDPFMTFGLVLLLVTMMLLQWSDLRGRLFGFIPGNVSHTTTALADAAERVGRFLFLQFIYNAAFGVIIGLVLWGLGVPYSGLWGLCAALFRYLPYIGPLLAAVMPLAVSLVTSSGWSQVAMVGAVFLVLELISNNFVEPWLYGSRLGVSEIGIVMASVVWACLWGPVGLLLATPLTVCIVVLGTHVPCLSFFAKLLGTEKAFSDPQQIYQRLVAGDSVEAAELTQKHVRETGSARFVSEVFFPALELARRDQVSRWLSAESTDHLLAETKAVCEELRLLEDTEPAPPPTLATGGRKGVIWSACPFSDAILPILENDLLLRSGAVEVVKSTSMVGSTVQALGEGGEKPFSITIIHLSGADTPRVAGIVKRIVRSIVGVPVQVARFGGKPFSVEEKAQLAEAGASALAVAASEVRIWMAAHADLAAPSAVTTQK